MSEKSHYTDKEITDSNIVFHDEFDAEIYDWKWGKKYGSEEMERMLGEYCVYMGEELGRVGRYLDIGCGTGTAVVNLSLTDRIEEAHGSDISIGMLRACHKNAKGAHTHVILTQSNAESLPYRDESFDFITCHAILHHVPHPEQVVREVHRLLKPGGRALVAEPVFHISRNEFQESIAAMKGAGLRVEPGPRIPFSRTAVLRGAGDEKA